MRDAELRERFGQLGEPGAAEREAGIVDRARRALGLGIAIERDEASAAVKQREDAARVPAAAEGGVDVRAAFPDRQRRNGLFEKDGDVVAIGHQSEKPSSSGGSAPAGNAGARAVASCQRTSSHSSNLLPCPTSTT